MKNKKQDTAVETVYSPVKDEKMQSHLDDSEVWKQAYHEEEITEEDRRKHPRWYKYTLKFDGLRPIQLTKFEAV